MSASDATEAQIQSACVMWLWNSYPQTRGLFFAVTNNSEHAVRALQRKSLGLVAGVSDCLFMWRGKTYCFEFKTLTGRMSDAQKKWSTRVMAHSFDYFVVRDFESFKQLIQEIL